MKKTFLLCAVSALLGSLLAIMLYDPPNIEPIAAAQLSGPQDFTPEELVNIAVYENAARSAVNISTQSVHTDRFFMFEQVAKGEGSGTVIDRKGHIVTNYHVVEGAQVIDVTLFDGKEYQNYDAQLVGADPETDIAVLKIDAPSKSLFPVNFGNSAGLKVGQRVFAIGNPFGLEHTLSTGIISSLKRSLPARSTRRTLKSIIQIDASINPGSSGGPLLDSAARMIGMNTAIASKTGESAGVGFAIPVDTIGRIAAQLIRHGHVPRVHMGVDRVVVMERGLLIATLISDGPAEKAGLRGLQVINRRIRRGPYIYEKKSLDWSTADLIVAIDGTRVHTVDDLLTLVETKEPGSRVAVSIIREGKQQVVQVQLEAEEE